MKYILRGLTAQGVECWYTGRAGAEWLSHVKSDAFEYGLMAEARRKAKVFNGRADLHGVWFLPMPISGRAE